MNFIIDINTEIICKDWIPDSVENTVNIFRRDMTMVFDISKGLKNCNGPSSCIVIGYASDRDEIFSEKERFILRFECENPYEISKMYVIGSDDLGIIFGLLHISKEYLGIDPFWFWTDKQPVKQSKVEIPAIEEYISPIPRTRYRGWFVNDEVCLIGWKDEYPPTKEIWFPVFETLLRCGGNIVIPGTDLPRHGIHFELASQMGLWITHHHAEPLGAEMFLRAFPDKTPSYDLYPNLFEGLWRESVIKNKDKKVVWVLGFRGQGDLPFWLNDPKYNTPESRSEMIERVIKKQYEILSEYVDNPICCTYLYGEITELYRGGYLKLPEGIIKIWSDNGYGKMVSRRQENQNSRVDSLPLKIDNGPHGLYYHATFHDLQASSHLTMLANSPEFVNDELAAAFDSGTDEFVLVNCGNIRPHVYMLDIIKNIWLKGKIDINKHGKDFGDRFFGTGSNEVMECYRSYFEKTIKYGENYDDRAGDEFYHHPVRAMIDHWVKGKDNEKEETLIWATGDISFEGQVKYFKSKCEKSLSGWKELRQKCKKTYNLLSGEEGIFFKDNLMLQVELHYTGVKGVISFCESYLLFLQSNYPAAFIKVSEAIEDFSQGVKAMEDAEHGKWKNFYRADWLTNVKCTMYSLDTLRRYIRMFGDSPHFFIWYKEHIIPENERKIYLENTQRRTLSDDELSKLLKQHLIDNEL